MPLKMRNRVINDRRGEPILYFRPPTFEERRRATAGEYVEPLEGEALTTLLAAGHMFDMMAPKSMGEIRELNEIRDVLASVDARTAKDVELKESEHTKLIALAEQDGPKLWRGEADQIIQAFQETDKVPSRQQQRASERKAAKAEE